MERTFNSQTVDAHAAKPRLRMASAMNVFSGTGHLDPVMQGSQRTARKRTGGPTAAAQQLLTVSRHDCPWQIYRDPESGGTRLERKYDPGDEPLTQTEIGDLT